MSTSNTFNHMPDPSSESGTLEQQLAVWRARLQTLQAEREAGHLGEAAYEPARQAIEQSIVQAVMAAPMAPVHRSQTPGRKRQIDQRGSRTSKRLYWGAGAAILAIATATYAWVGTPSAVYSQTPPSAGAVTESPHGSVGGDGTPANMTFEQMRQRTETLAARLQNNSDDLAGWSMLARSYAVLGNFKESVAAYNKAIVLAPQDAQLLVDYADTLAMNNGRSLQGEPVKWITKALKLDPSNLKALALAGTAAFERRDYSTAVAHWERALKVAQPGSDFERRLKDSLSDARAAIEPGKASVAGNVTSPVPSASHPQNQASTTAAGSAAVVRGTVGVSEALRSKVKADDALFVFAVPTDGSRMPVAVLRAKVKDLPLNFELNDSQAMSPGAKLSMHKQVLIRARISKTGDAMPKVGDLEGETAAVDVGSSQVQVSIARERN